MSKINNPQYKLTVFTPTFNRAHTLVRTYESLCNQTLKDFIWMIIDDGSSDHTKNLVDQWKAENIIPIEYYYKENGGMHTAHNLAYEKITTELNVCIDSDDMMPMDAVEKIIHLWTEAKHPDCAGIIGLDADFNGNILGSKMPSEVTLSTLSEIHHKYRVTGDKKLVYRTDIMREIEPYPEFEGETLVPLGYKYFLVDQKYKMFLSNEVLCNVEYQADGSSNTIFKQYIQSPKGFAEARKIRMKYSPYLIDRFKSAIHYVSSSIFIQNKQFLGQSPRKLLTMFSIPMGILLNFYIKFKVKNM